MSLAALWEWATANPAMSIPMACVVGFVMVNHTNPQQNVYRVSPPGNRHRQARNIRKAKAEGRAKQRARDIDKRKGW